MASSRAVRTPNRYEHNSNFFSGTLIGNHDVDSETLLAYEAGFRTLINEKLSFEIALFYNYYSDIIVTDRNPPNDPVVNDAEAQSYGFEISSNYFVTPDWQLTLSYSYFDTDIDYKDQTTGDILPIQEVTANHQASIYSHFKFNKDLSWDTNIYYQDGKNPSLNYLEYPSTSSFIKLDTKINWRYNDKLDFYLMGKNLLQDSHEETLYFSEIPRTFLIGVEYSF
jgi:iron complex outermembrane receptor protein